MVSNPIGVMDRERIPVLIRNRYRTRILGFRHDSTNLSHHEESSRRSCLRIRSLPGEIPPTRLRLSSILAGRLSRALGEEIAKVEAAGRRNDSFSTWMDGHFVPNISFRNSGARVGALKSPGMPLDLATSG